MASKTVYDRSKKKQVPRAKQNTMTWPKILKHATSTGVGSAVRRKKEIDKATWGK